MNLHSTIINCPIIQRSSHPIRVTHHFKRKNEGGCFVKGLMFGCVVVVVVLKGKKKRKDKKTRFGPKQIFRTLNLTTYKILPFSFSDFFVGFVLGVPPSSNLLLLLRILRTWAHPPNQNMRLWMRVSLNLKEKKTKELL